MRLRKVEAESSNNFFRPPYDCSSLRKAVEAFHSYFDASVTNSMNFKLAGKYKITTDESDSNYNLPSLFNNDESQDEFVDLVTRLGETNTSEVSRN